VLVRRTGGATGAQVSLTLGEMEVQALQAPMDPPPAGRHPASAAAGGASHQVAPPAALAPTAPAAAAAAAAAAVTTNATHMEELAVVVGGVAPPQALAPLAHPAAAPSPSTPPPPSSKCGTAHWTLGMAATAATAALVAQGGREACLADAVPLVTRATAMEVVASRMMAATVGGADGAVPAVAGGTGAPAQVATASA